MIRISLNVKSKGTEKIDVFHQRTDDFKNLRYETLYIADYKYVNISGFAALDMKLWLKEDSDSDTDHLLFIQIHSLEGSKLIQNIVIL